jgi:hypothetical protein
MLSPYDSRGRAYGRFITETSNNAKQMLDFSLASIGRGTVGVRADGLVVPPGSACTSSGAAHADRFG